MDCEIKLKKVSNICNMNPVLMLKPLALALGTYPRIAGIYFEFAKRTRRGNHLQSFFPTASKNQGSKAPDFVPYVCHG